MFNNVFGYPRTPKSSCRPEGDLSCAELEFSQIVAAGA
jgi:hypothetical protein